MSYLAALKQEFVQLGYDADAVQLAYRYGDVLDGGEHDLSIGLAAFMSTPASYRTAAFGVAEGEQRDAVSLARGHRSLGAPYLFVVSGEAASLWIYDEGGNPIRWAETTSGGLGALLRETNRDWSPEGVRRDRRARDGRDDPQGNLFDGVFQRQLATVTRTRLGALVSQAVCAFGDLDDTLSRPVFQALFRMIAAKVLADRGHHSAREWKDGSVLSVIRGISRHYGLVDQPGPRIEAGQLRRAWDVIANGLNLSNVSADDLAYVYENAFVTAATRSKYATHSTPVIVAEHVVGSIDFERFDPRTLRVYEPFCGASPLLLAAMGRVRDLLPMSMPDGERHKVLVRCLSGDDFDPFAVEVSKLSLILGDWPNSNGWDIGEVDLFEAGQLDTRLAGADIVVCNPPFEAFLASEKPVYPEAAAQGRTKGAAVLSRIFAAKPAAFGIVMPQALLQGSTFDAMRRSIESDYASIRTVSLPDNVFHAAALETSLLIAQDRRDTGGGSRTRIVSEHVRDADRKTYLATGAVSVRRTTVRSDDPDTRGNLWVRSLEDLWQHLGSARSLGDVASVHRGIEWKVNQTTAIARSAAEGHAKGLGNIGGSLLQFTIGRAAYLDVRPANARRALSHPWDRPKVVMNAIRHGRGRWPLAAAVDRSGLYCSQQFFGIWPREEADLAAISAILNGPLANAFVIDGSAMKGLRVDAVRDIPLPSDLSKLRGIGDLIDAYTREVADFVLDREDAINRLNALLHDIDRAVLRAYALPQKLEDELLEFFVGHEAARTLRHRASHWRTPVVEHEPDGTDAAIGGFLGLPDLDDPTQVDPEGLRLKGLLARMEALVGDADFEIDALIEDDLA